MSPTLPSHSFPADSVLHRLDPRVKLVVTLLLVLGITLTPARAWPAYPLPWALVASLAAFGGERGPAGMAGARRAAVRAGRRALLVTTPGPPITEAFGMAITGPAQNASRRSLKRLSSRRRRSRGDAPPGPAVALGALRCRIWSDHRLHAALPVHVAGRGGPADARACAAPPCRGTIAWEPGLARAGGGRHGGQPVPAQHRTRRAGARGHGLAATRASCAPWRRAAARAVAWGMVPVGVLIGIRRWPCCGGVAEP